MIHQYSLELVSAHEVVASRVIEAQNFEEAFSVAKKIAEGEEDVTSYILTRVWCDVITGSMVTGKPNWRRIRRRN